MKGFANLIKVITAGDIGKWVEYKGHNSTERGRVKSFNDKFVFVVFHCDDNWNDYQNYTGCACRPVDLEWMPEKVAVYEV